MIQFEEVTKEFRANFWETKFLALDHINFTIPKGKLTGFLGANGAGKTTSIKILLGLIRPTSGRVIIDPTFARNREEFCRKLGYLPERPYFYPYLTGHELVDYMASLTGISKSLVKKNKERYAERLGIAFALERKIKSYSKGMLQRVGMLCALIHDPSVIILDEPLSGLDPVGRKEFKDILVALNKEGKSIFFSSHIVSDVEEICDSVIVVEKGKLIYQGDISSLLAQSNKQQVEFTIKEQGKIEKIICPLADKEKTLQKLLSENKSLHEIRHQTASLEEVVYQIRS